MIENIEVENLHLPDVDFCHKDIASHYVHAC